MNDSLFHKKYKEEGLQNSKKEIPETFEIEGSCPSNIALVKYWGKFGNQYPKNPSISFSLTKSFTNSRITYKKSNKENFSLEYYFENRRNLQFELRLNNYFKHIQQYFPFLKGLELRINSHNTFPHSAGIASSASAFSSLAMCICKTEKQLFGSFKNKNDLLQKASFMSRIGSGSACRSVYNGTVLWGKTQYFPGSSNEVAIDINKLVNPIFTKYHDAIIVIDSSPKKMSSSEGHKLMNSHVYADSRYKQANVNLELLIRTLSSGDELEFARIVENEALSLHALMLSSSPGFVLLHPNSL
jgi:diphosphomevalonate decarboxylase